MALATVLLLALSQPHSTPVTISERTLRVQPGVTFELVARGREGCFTWSSEREDVASVIEERCEGATSIATVKTHVPPATEDAPSRVISFITARPLVGDPDAVFCEVLVGRIATLRILQTVRQMVAHELQWLHLAAEDAEGNEFSPPAVAALDVYWRFEPEGLVRLLPPAETRQQLDPALAAASEDGRWRRYHRVAVLAGGQPSDAITATATIAPTMGGRAVVGRERLSVEPSSQSLAAAQGH